MSEHDEPGGWEPRNLPGGIYCSRRCGCNCTRAEYDRAVSESAALAAVMGDGWSPRVWENGGWNYDVQNGVAKVSVNYEIPYERPRVIRGYTGWINSEVCGQVIVEADDPLNAFGFAMQGARTRLAHYEAELNAVSNATGEEPS